MKTITMIGPLPDPKGGVSIHIVRLGNLVSGHFHVQHIDESSIIKDKYFNICSKKLFRYLRILWNTDIVHIHSGITLLRVSHLLIARLLLRKRVIVTMHAIVSLYGLESLINRTFLRLANVVIMVSDAIQNKAKLENTVVKPAFIPPDVSAEPALPDEINYWLK